MFSEDNDLLSWQNRHPEHWGTKEVLDYVYYLADHYQMDWACFCGEHFRGIDGSRMCRMTKEDFVRLEPTYGHYIYETFSNLRKQGKYFIISCCRIMLYSMLLDPTDNCIYKVY